MKYSISRLVALLLLGATILGIASGTANAQAKAALVRSVDEPGRVPYQHAIDLTANDSRCGGDPAFSCDVAFPGVPSGKRLVIQYVSATQVVNSGSEGLATVRADTSGLYVNIAPVGHQPLGGGSINLTFSQAVHAYVEAGDTPHMIVGTIGAGVNNSFGRTYFISGYLVDVLP